MHGGGDQILCIVEMSREAEVEKGVPEQQINTSIMLEH
jgi:hypothetical protein